MVDSCPAAAARAPRSAPARNEVACPDHLAVGVGHRDELGLRARLGVDALPGLEAYTGRPGEMTLHAVRAHVGVHSECIHVGHHHGWVVGLKLTSRSVPRR
jgi:hypothetical protein